MLADEDAACAHDGLDRQQQQVHRKVRARDDKLQSWGFQLNRPSRARAEMSHLIDDRHEDRTGAVARDRERWMIHERVHLRAWPAAASIDWRRSRVRRVGGAICALLVVVASERETIVIVAAGLRRAFRVSHRRERQLTRSSWGRLCHTWAALIVVVGGARSKPKVQSPVAYNSLQGRIIVVLGGQATLLLGGYKVAKPGVYVRVAIGVDRVPDLGPPEAIELARGADRVGAHVLPQEPVTDLETLGWQPRAGCDEVDRVARRSPNGARLELALKPCRYLVVECVAEGKYSRMHDLVVEQDAVERAVDAVVDIICACCELFCCKCLWDGENTYT